MSHTDTSAEAVERLAEQIAGEARGFRVEADVIGCLRTQTYSEAALLAMAKQLDDAAATLRALLAERDALTIAHGAASAERDAAMRLSDHFKAEFVKHFDLAASAQEERDAARAEAARLREALERLCRNQHAPGSLADAFWTAREALAGMEPGHD